MERMWCGTITWEPECNLNNAKEAIQEFEEHLTF